MTAGVDITTDLEFSLWKGNSKIYGEYVTTSKTVTYEYTPSITATYRINFRLRDYGYDGPDQTFYLDNVIIRNTALALIEENNYYPFGSKHQGYNSVVSSNANAVATKFKYNGKELQDDLIGGNSLGLYDYGARMYDPALGRWHVVDPLAEKYESETGVKVDFKLFFPPDIYSQKVIAAARAGNLPDMFGVLGEKRMLASFVKAGHILDLTPFMKEDGNIWMNQNQLEELSRLKRSEHWRCQPGRRRMSNGVSR